MERRQQLTRFVIGPLAIVAAFFFFDRSGTFIQVWKPLLLYYALAIPGFYLLDRLRRRAA